MLPGTSLGQATRITALVALANRSLGWQDLKASLLSTGRTAAMIFFIKKS